VIKVIANGERLPPVMMLADIPPEQVRDQHAQHERFLRNWGWVQANARELRDKHRNKFICVANQELFVADTFDEALALGAAAHPEDDGRCVGCVD